MVELSERKTFRAITWQVFLPYRLFVDDGNYSFMIDNKRWDLSFSTHAEQNHQTKLPNISGQTVKFHKRQQYKHDSHGFTGVSEVGISQYLNKHITKDEFSEDRDIQMVKQFDFQNALSVLNRFVSIYRAKTNEFWCRPISELDIFAYNVFILPSDSNVLESYSWSLVGEIASGIVYLKSEKWYKDLFNRINEQWQVPFFLELVFEGQDALARKNYRLAVGNFALAVEALFRSLISECFPDIKQEMKSEQMINIYFDRYSTIDKDNNPSVKKKTAKNLFGKIWGFRNKLMHGHDIEITMDEAEQANDAIHQLSTLWFSRPKAEQPPIIEGPFSGNEIINNAQTWVERAVVRYSTGFIEDAEEAATFALMQEPDNGEAMKILAEIEKRKT